MSVTTDREAMVKAAVEGQRAALASGGQDGLLAAEKNKRQREELARRIAIIADQIRDVDTDPSDISRSINAEIGVITAATVAGVYDNKEGASLVKSLREMGRQLSDTEVLSKKDILNWDGPKFRHAIERFVELFQKAMRESGVGEDQKRMIMKHFSDILAQQEPIVRKEVQRM